MPFTPSLCHKLSHLLRPLPRLPLERDVLYGRPLGLSRPILKIVGFQVFLKPKKCKVSFLGFLIFKSEFLLFHVKLCKCL